MYDVSVIIPVVSKSSRLARTREVVRRLQEQRAIALEIIIVMQGFDETETIGIDGVKTIFSRVFSSSHSRNVGACHATADLISFLDDDTFPAASDFYRRVKTILDVGAVDFVTCNIVSNGKRLAASRIESDVQINRQTIIGNMWEPGLTLRRKTFLKFQFDATLGIGAIHGSGEGFDLGARLVDAGLKGKRLAGLEIDHPPLPLNSEFDVQRTFYYSLGNGSSLVARGFHKAYAKQLFKQVAKTVLYPCLNRWSEAKLALLRLTCLLIGPAIPRGVPKIIPNQLAKDLIDGEIDPFPKVEPRIDRATA
ncbi:glycosyltransferase [Neorhizobium sp. DAR64861/K0K2]|uniref:glycosyltransferase n=1 Tax=unclassified Neorhizobium TaxID=2629175 RepID=UPI003D2BA8E1